MERGLDAFFEVFLRKNSVFFDKKAIQSSYIPENIPHRDEQISQIANILSPLLKGEKPSNLFIYGKTGTGKTLTIKQTTNKIMEVANKEEVPLKVIYINCKLKKSADTEYRLMAQLARELGKNIPPTGLPDRKSTRLNSSHSSISYAVFCLKKKKNHALPSPSVLALTDHSHISPLLHTY